MIINYQKQIKKNLKTASNKGRMMNTIIKKICFSLLIMQCALLSLSARDDDDNSAFALAALNTDTETDDQVIKETEKSDTPAGEQRISEKSYAKIKSIREVLKFQSVIV